MDAKELTIVVNKLKDRVSEQEKQIEYLTQEFEKQRLIISDMSIDVKMMQRRK